MYFDSYLSDFLGDLVLEQAHSPSGCYLNPYSHTRPASKEKFFLSEKMSFVLQSSQGNLSFPRHIAAHLLGVRLAPLPQL